jgi:hypothetical protein
MLSSKGSLGPCIPKVFRHSYIALSRRTDNGHYVTHSLALRNEIRTWCCVEKGVVAKKVVFSLTTIAGRKWPFFLSCLYKK